MKASELRIGNYVTIENRTGWPDMKGIPLQVTEVSARVDEDFPTSTASVTLSGYGVKTQFSQFDEFLCPIPLTSEWLEKLGFDIDSHYQYLPCFSKGNVCIWCDEDRWFKADQERYTSEGIEIKHVHQLQNLYFALT